MPSAVKPTSPARRLSDACARARGRMRCRAVLPTAAMLLAALVVAFAGSAAGQSRVVVVQAVDTPRIAKTLAGLSKRTPAPVEVFMLPAARGPEVESALRRRASDATVVALGPGASDYLLTLASPLPAVHCLAGLDALRAGLPAVPSETPADHQAAWLRKLVPGATRVGVLFDPQMSARRAEAVAAAFELAGYKVLLQPVDGPAALPPALAKLNGRADVLVALHDRTVYAPEAANGILLFSFRAGIPLIGPSQAWVRRGALFAIDWDYEEVGAACAALAARVPGARSVAPPPPRPRIHVNPKIATRFGLGWDAALLAAPGVEHE
jgi:putative ABC transport system substrate-binding protein